MKALKVGYSLLMTALLTLSVVLAIGAFYQAPKRYDYPQYPTRGALDYNSPEYQEELKKYDENVKNYQERNKDLESQRKIWGQNNFIICLIAAGIMLVGGILLINYSYFLSISLLFAAFVLVIFGPGLVSYYADSMVIPFLGTEPKVNLTIYKQIQFFITLVGTVIGGGLSFLIHEKDKSG